MATETRNCFIIGPMSDDNLKQDARLRILKREIVQPIFGEIERRDGIRYIAKTPWDFGGAANRITDEILYEIDRAHLVIADLTGNNGNVFYELGITHALGRACIPVMEDTADAKILFDVAAYRVTKITLNDRNYVIDKEIMRPVIERAHKDISNWKTWQNPVIDFFRAPITYISPAFSLANGYFVNFVRPFVESMIAREKGSYLYDLKVGSEIAQKAGTLDSERLLTADERGRVNLHVVVPSDVQLCNRDNVNKLGGSLLRCILERGRGLSAYYRADDKNSALSIVDIPTTVIGINDAVRRRMLQPNTPRTSPEWREIERMEIQNFVLVLSLLINETDDQIPGFARRVSVVTYAPEAPGDHTWLHTILTS